MPSAPSKQRALVALCLLATLGAGLGLFWSWSPATPPEVQPFESGPPSTGVLDAARVDGVLADGLEAGPQRAQVAETLPDAGGSLEPGNALRLRFLAGSTGLAAAELKVELLALAPEGHAEDPGTSADFSGRSDAQGFLAVPAALRESGFAIRVRASNGGQRWAAPQLWNAVELAAATGMLEVQVFGIWAVVEALVLDEHDQPVAGAGVQFDFESPALAYSTRDVSTHSATTDSKGVAMHVLQDPASVGGRMWLKARVGDDRFSEQIELPPPLASTRVQLVLTTTAGAILRISSADGTPLPGAMARLERLDPPFASSGRSTDLHGLAKFKPLEPGRYAASAQDPSTGSSARSEFLLQTCQLAEASLVLPPSELPLAIAGSVRTLDGRPVTWLAVSICVDGREEARVSTDAEGRYRYHRAPCERLRVRLRTPFDGPQIEPEVIDAAFGASGADFVLSDAPRLGFAALRVVERGSGEPLSGAAVAVFRDSAAERVGGVVIALAGSALHLGTNEDGVVFVPSGAQLPSAHLIVEKRGFVRRELDLSAIGQLPFVDGHAILELERGWRHSWVVLDQQTGSPVAGAIATQGVDPFTGRPIEDGSTWPPSGPSDSRGILELALPAAPRRVRIEAPGYEPRIVEVFQGPSSLAPVLSVGDTILLNGAR